MAFVVKGFIPAWRQLNSDFPNYYLVARLYRAGYPMERVYDWVWLQRQADHQAIGHLVGFIPLTLPSALVVLPLTSLDPLEAKRVWLIANLLFLVAILLLLTRISKLTWVQIAILVFLAFDPLRQNFLLGQMHILVLLLLTLATWAHFRKWPYVSGICLAVAAALKIYPALFLLLLVFKRQWRAAGSLVAGLACAVFASFYLFGKEACQVYVREVLPAALRGDTFDPYNIAWNSLPALLRRLFVLEPELNPHPVAHAPWLYALLQPLTTAAVLVMFLWFMGSERGDDDKFRRDWASYLFLVLFLSSQPASYHYIALALAAVLFVDAMAAGKQIWLASITILAYAFTSIPRLRLPPEIATGWRNLLFFPRAVSLSILAGALLVWLWSELSLESRRRRFQTSNLLVAGASFLVLTVVGFASTQSHLRGQFDNYGTRIVTAPGDVAIFSPVVTPSGVLFTEMTLRNYSIGRLQGPPLTLPENGGNWFHPAASDRADSIWAEQPMSGQSRIVRFNNAAQGISPAVEAEQAEEPVVSRDGKFLAFLRPLNGRNSLWIAPLGTPPGKEHEVAGAEYDVREANFLADHRVVFSSKRSGQFALYVTTPAGSVEELDRPACAARFPSMSTDGRWLAFSCYERGHWQLHAMEWDGSRNVQFTTAECNSVSPSWTPDSKRLVYATDCGRGLNLAALAEVTVTP